MQEIGTAKAHDKKSAKKEAARKAVEYLLLVGNHSSGASGSQPDASRSSSSGLSSCDNMSYPNPDYMMMNPPTPRVLNTKLPNSVKVFSCSFCMVQSLQPAVCCPAANKATVTHLLICPRQSNSACKFYLSAC